MPISRTTSFCGLLLAAAAFGQSEDDGPRPVTIEKVPVVLRPVERYQVPLTLEPVMRVTLAAAGEGPVAAVLTKVGEKPAPQSELVRLDDAEASLLVQRAQAQVDATEGLNKSVAELDLKIAQLRLERLKLLAPLEATVTAIHVVPGQFVRVGDDLLTLSDRSKLRAEVPVERGSVKEGDALDLTVDGKTVSGTVLRVEPLPERLAPLRDLFESVAAAVVEFDNTGGQLAEGQTVRSPLIPREPVIEAENSALVNGEDGVRRVFVLRDGVAVSVPVQPLGSVSETRTFLSGRFGAKDELVIGGADQLEHGAIVSQTPTAAAAGSSARDRRSPGAGVMYDEDGDIISTPSGSRGGTGF